MRKTVEKIFATAGVLIAVVLIVILVVTAFGGIQFEEFENSLVRGLFITLGILYVVLACVSLTMLFVSDDVVKEIVLRSEQEGMSRVTVSVVRKLVKQTCSSIEGVKSGKVALVSNEYGVRLKVSVKITDKNVVETETYIRTMLEEVFKGALGFKFHAIEIKVTALQPAFKVAQSDVTEKVDEILAAKAEEELTAEEDETSVETEVADTEATDAEVVTDETVVEGAEAAATESEATEAAEDAVEAVESEVAEPAEEEVTEKTEEPEKADEEKKEAAESGKIDNNDIEG